MAAAELAGDIRAAMSNTKKTELKTEVNKEPDTVAAVKAPVIGKKAATEAGNRKTTVNIDGHTTSHASPTETVTQHADEAPRLAVTATTNVAELKEDLEQAQVTSSECEQSKTIKNDGSTAKSKKETIAIRDGALRKDSSAEGAETGEISADVAEKIVVHVEASARPAEATATKGKSDTEESSDDDSRTDSQKDLRSVARSDALAQMNNLDTAQLAISAASPTDTAVNGASKPLRRRLFA
jgi:hypothetical protein